LLARQDRILCLLLFAAAFLLFLPWSDFPNEYNFDETHYVTAAKLLVPPVENWNWEHPPLAKYLIGIGIAVAGDRPLGWRIAGMVFGALSVAGMYACALAIFRERRLALWTALLTLFNMMLFVLARTAMLDIFLLAFLVWGIAALSFAWDEHRPPRQVRGLLAFAGVMFGLAAACKWVGWVPVIFVLLLWFTLRLLQWNGAKLYRAPRAVTNAVTNDEDWYSPALWHGIAWSDIALWMLITPILAYAITFIPYFWLPGEEGTFADMVLLQRDMAITQSLITGYHYYSSQWYQWPFGLTHIWFYFKNTEGWTRAILLMGNPAIFFPGFFAALFCSWIWWRRRTREAFLAVVWYWLLFLCFSVIPRKMSFFHYYLPAACMLSLPLAYLFRSYGGPPLFRVAWGRWAYLGISVAVFALFYAVLVGLPLPSDFSPR
jgi:dolichyl-phosphate-mannose-protein mannosyltransferase